jgi:hypothetical protein
VLDHFGRISVVALVSAHMERLPAVKNLEQDEGDVQNLEQS